MVDMPGYGFATASHAEIMGWQETMKEYIESRSALKRLFLLIDSRHGMKHIDTQFMEYLDKIGRRYSCVLTKCDLVTAEDLARRVFIIEQRLRLSRRGTHEVFMVSERSPMAIEHFQKAILQLATSQED
jgi:GTP-binding protein